jgi:protein-S-isoprenylcysteine O-methyltransferase Ste14
LTYVSRYWEYTLSKAGMIQALYRWRVRYSLVGLILAVVLARPNLQSLLAGLGFCILGLLLRAWACGYLRKDIKLTTSGPYRYTRNPLYLANLIIGISVVAAARSWWVFGFFCLYFLLFYPVIIRREKDKMEGLFPEQYQEYSQKVPLFFPTLKPIPFASEKTFDWALFKKNKERRAGIAALIFWTTIILKMILF